MYVAENDAGWMTNEAWLAPIYQLDEKGCCQFACLCVPTMFLGDLCGKDFDFS
jgi:hypothetical protein